jgi:hypothetical protein
MFFDCEKLKCGFDHCMKLLLYIKFLHYFLLLRSSMFFNSFNFVSAKAKIDFAGLAKYHPL